ncbi:alternate F1F0 ATPase, F1 subunit alpha [Roseibium aggregatum]|uniref:ATP synthase subunit alpha n=1 Tax=Roseibium aggregatum TaxID=187304 RepID=A0A926S7J6_9HYPH|nr:alternate F1F0 ATPase, F1 subunit alpha [Roseibium aggregatum]MBD1548350.1 alternate F1F0 ATPase, F1 subunit alpha [Roseibium aggregatum]
MPEHTPENLTDKLFDQMDEVLDKTEARLEVADIARVLSVGNGIAEIAGFTDLYADELVSFPHGEMGIASSLGEERTGVIVLGPTDHIRPGDTVMRTRRVVDVPVGDGLLGRVVDPLGQPLDGGKVIQAEARLPIERPALPIMHRAPVIVPLQTGIKAIDAAIPIGRGQRELILGDRQTGKTAIAVDTILNQHDSGVVSIYCAIGQRASAVARVIQALREGKALERTIVVVASADEAPGLQFVAPYVATSMAEHFMEKGRDVLVVYDDLTRHARAYRELSLLLRRPPGREAYPGDIFYIHSRLLERSARRRDEFGGGSVTALPIIETQAQNISAYVPTNLISITDGQIYLSPGLFEKGQLPAIDIGDSVSRVGGKTQLPAYRSVAGDLRLFYAQFEELESFARFGTQIDPETRMKIDRGLRVREILKQNEHVHLSVVDQIVALLAATSGLFDTIPPDRIAEAEKRVCEAASRHCPEICTRIEVGEELRHDDRDGLIETMKQALQVLLPDAGGDR